MHHFSDASEKSYGYVFYLRLLNELGEIHCSFLIGKIKLTPMKTLTTLRLKLCAASIAVRLDKKLRAELNFPCPLEPSAFWTDRVSMLRYINNESSVFHTFVANRVQLFRDLSQPEQWCYCTHPKKPS